MNDAKLEQLIKPLIKIYDELELRLIKDIAIRLNTYDEVKGSLKWYLDKLEDIGGFHYDSLELLAEYSGKSQKEVKEILKYAGYDTSKLDRYKPAIDDEKILNNPTSMFEDYTVQNIVNQTIRETNSMMDLIQTKALESAEQNYIKILTDTYLKVSGGIYSYDTAIRQGLKEMAKNGFTGATYKNGKELSLEATVRRDVLTKSHQLSAEIEIEKARDVLKTNLVYVTQHLGARIRTKYTKENYEVHADWQGKVYMLDGSNDKYDNFYEKTGYGELLGLCGVNCRHHVLATKEGWSHPDLIDQEENEKAYLKQQEQRKYERRIRQYKREKEIAKALDDKEELKSINSRYTTFNKKYNKFLEKNNLRRDYSREYIEKDLVNTNNELKLPKNILEIIKDQRQPTELEEKIINKYLTKDNMKLTNKDDVVMQYSSKYDKILINPNHPELENYDIYQSLTHEITHMLDIRTGFVKNNREILTRYMDNAYKNIIQNEEYYINVFEKNSVRRDMNISDLFASITKNRIYGSYAHDIDYWNKKYTREREMVANIANIYISNNKEIIDIINKTPSLNQLYRKVVDWYEKNI